MSESESSTNSEGSDDYHLSLSISAPPSAVKIDNLFVTTTLTNTGARTVKLVTTPHTTFFNLPTDIFRITGERGSPKFIGCKVKFSIEAMIANRGPSAFTVLAPGDTYRRTHHLMRAYDFSGVGPGLFEIDFVSSRYRYMTPSGELAPGAIRPTTSPGQFILGDN